MYVAEHLIDYFQFLMDIFGGGGMVPNQDIYKQKKKEKTKKNLLIIFKEINADNDLLSGEKVIGDHLINSQC